MLFRDPEQCYTIFTSYQKSDELIANKFTRGKITAPQWYVEKCVATYYSFYIIFVM